MKRQLLLCALVALTGAALLVVSPSVIAGFSKTDAKVVRGHNVQPLAFMFLNDDESLNSKS